MCKPLMRFVSFQKSKLNEADRALPAEQAKFEDKMN